MSYLVVNNEAIHTEGVCVERLHPYGLGRRVYSASGLQEAQVTNHRCHSRPMSSLMSMMVPGIIAWNPLNSAEAAYDRPRKDRILGGADPIFRETLGRVVEPTSEPSLHRTQHLAE